MSQMELWTPRGYERHQQVSGSEIWYDTATGATVVNETAIPSERVLTAIQEQHPEMASLIRWSQQTKPSSIFERDKYVTPRNIFRQMETAYQAVQHDDVIAGVVETSEALAFGRLDFDLADEDEANVWMQIAEDIDLESRLREMWREIFTISQCYMAVVWGRRMYKVRGLSDQGVKRKKTYDLRVPVGMSLLDPLKVIPVGNFMFGQERLAYYATPGEAFSFVNVLNGDNAVDLVVSQLIEGHYEPSEAERSFLSDLDINPDYLFLLNDKNVWRHTETRPSYERFAPIRLKSVFELLDLKHQLRAMDRAFLLGSTNFIIVVKKGTDQLPAKPQEVADLAAQMRASARIPVLIGDHRLTVEIVTPKTDNTLSQPRYNVIDLRLEARLYGMFMSGGFGGARGDDSVKVAKVVGRGLEGRRSRLVDAFRRNVLLPTLALNPEMHSDDIRLQFRPKHIAIDFDPAVAALMQDLRDRGDLSRETVLDELDFEQSEEARKREREQEIYDHIFTPVNVPFDSPAKQDPNKPTTPAEQKTAGRTQGGNRKGGGINPDSRTANSNPVRPRKGNNG